MPLSVNDPSYKAETVPASIAAMEQPLCSAYGVGLYAFGAKGNLVHYSGYHRSRQWILSSPDSNYGSRDYSVTQSLDKGGDERWVCAFDFTPGSWGTAENRRRMVEITRRVYTAAKARDPRLSSLREFAGTLDGKTVVTFNCADGSLKGAFDSSHLDHVHGSFWRSRAGNNHSGILQVLLGQQEEPMPYLAKVELGDGRGLAVVLTDNIHCRWVTDDYSHLEQRYGAPAVLPLPPHVAGVLVGPVPDGWRGHLPVASDVELNDEQLQQLSTDVSAAAAAAVGEAVGEPLTVEDITAAVDETITGKLNATRLSVT